MRSTLALVCASFAAVAYAQTAPLLINTPTPNPVECQPTLITYSGGQTPYIITLANGDDHTQVIQTFGTDFTNTSFTWNTNVPGNTNVILFIKDNTGFTQNSAAFVITPGSDSCITGSSGSPPPASSPPSTDSSTTPASTPPPGSTPPATSASTPPPSSPSSTKPASSPPASNSGSKSSAAPSSSTTGAATRATGVPAAAAAAALGAVFAALL